MRVIVREREGDKQKQHGCSMRRVLSMGLLHDWGLGNRNGGSDF